MASNCSKAGALLFVGSVQFGIFLIVAESLSRTYSVQANYISDLGALFPASEPVFNTSILVFGLFAAFASYFLHRGLRWAPLSVLVLIAAIGMLGVGTFHEGSPFDLHEIFSLVTFLSTGLAAIVAARFEKAPLSYFSVALGVFALVALLLFLPNDGSFGTSIGIGVGGLERMIVYPVLLWSVAFSGHLIGMPDRATA